MTENSNSKPYPLPDLAGAVSADTDVQVQLNEAGTHVVGVTPTVRDANAVNIANMGADARAHFLVNVEGAELCGACGTPFPCVTWTTEIEPRNLAASTGDDAATVELERKAENVAQLLGVPIERARVIVRETEAANEPGRQW